MAVSRRPVGADQPARPPLHQQWHTKHGAARRWGGGQMRCACAAKGGGVVSEGCVHVLVRCVCECVCVCVRVCLLGGVVVVLQLLITRCLICYWGHGCIHARCWLRHSFRCRFARVDDVFVWCWGAPRRGPRWAAACDVCRGGTACAQHERGAVRCGTYIRGIHGCSRTPLRDA